MGITICSLGLGWRTEISGTTGGFMFWCTGVIDPGTTAFTGPIV